MTAKADVGALQASGLIGLAAMEPELEYLFKHVLVQDAAYASLLKQERRQLHRRIADALVELYPERRDELAGVIGMHLEEAGEASRAALYLLEAGDQALARFANREAQAFFERAYTALASGAPDAGTARARVRAGIGTIKAGWGSTMATDELKRLGELIAIVDDLGEPRLAAEVHFWNILLHRSQSGAKAEEAIRNSMARLDRIGVEHGDPVAQAMPDALMGAGMVFGGQLRAGAALLEKAIPALTAGGDPLGTAVIHDVLTIAYARLGEFALAERNAERADRLAEKGDPIARLDAMLARAAIASERGDLDEAVRLAGACVADAESLGATGCAIPANYFLGEGRLRRDEAAAAKVPFERSIQLAAGDPGGEKQITLLAQAGLAAAVRLLGDLTAGGWDAPLAEARAIGDRYGEMAILFQRASTLAKNGDADWPAIISDLEKVIGVMEEIESRPALARALLIYARALERSGRADDAHAATVRAHQLARELGLRDPDFAEAA